MKRFCKNLNARRTIRLCLTCACALILLSSNASAIQGNSSETVSSQAKQKAAQINATQAPPAPKKMIPDSRIAQLRDFVEQHHQEVIPLLDFLAKKNPKKFQKVMIKYNREVSKLERAEKKSPGDYQTDLTAWVNQSRTQLYTAQLRVAKNSENAAILREKIKLLVTEKVDMRTKYLQQEQAYSLARAKRIEKMIENQVASRDAWIENKVIELTNKATKTNKKKKGSSGKKTKPRSRHPLPKTFNDQNGF